jgi:hypothetical protein
MILRSSPLDPRDDPMAEEFIPLTARPAIEQARWWALRAKPKRHKVRGAFTAKEARRMEAAMREAHPVYPMERSR